MRLSHIRGTRREVVGGLVWSGRGHALRHSALPTAGGRPPGAHSRPQLYPVSAGALAPSDSNLGPSEEESCALTARPTRLSRQIEGAPPSDLSRAWW